MDKGFLIYANGEEYLNQAYLCAMSLKATNNNSVSIITNNTVKEEYFDIFDKIIPIPWYEFNDNYYDVKNRWKIYHASPYENTIVLDADCIVLENFDDKWEFLKNYDLYFLSNVYTYRYELVTNDYYRKAFNENLLPNIYSGMHFFKKTDISYEFYKWLELVSNNWELFYGQFCKEFYPKAPSMDLSFSIVCKILDIDNYVTNKKINPIKFVHMKPYVQNWKNVKEDWQKKVGVYLTPELELIIGNYVQKGIFHYVDKTFVSDKIINQYKEHLCL